MANQNSRVYVGGACIEPEDSLYNAVVKRLKAGKTAKRALSCAGEQHICLREACNPETEGDLIRQGWINGPPLSSNVYLCNLGGIHVCTVRSCCFYQNNRPHTCHISGLNAGNDYSGYSKHNPMSWYTKPEYEISGGAINTVFVQEKRVIVNARRLLTQSGSMVDAMISERKKAKRPPPPPGPETVPDKKKPRRSMYNRAPSAKVVRKRAKAIVTLLLHSKHRVTINRRAQTEYDREAHHARETYLSACKDNGQFGFSVDIYRLMADKRSQPLPMVIFNYDETLLTYYVDVICQVWEMVLKYYVHPKHKQFDEDGAEIVPKIDVDSVCLGVLYDMRHGYKIGNTWVLPSDPFLMCNLPRINDLAVFENTKRSKYTKGQDILSTTYDNAINSQVPLAEISISVNGLKESVLVKDGKEVDTTPWILKCRSKRRSPDTL